MSQAPHGTSTPHASGGDQRPGWLPQPPPEPTDLRRLFRRVGGLSGQAPPPAGSVPRLADPQPGDGPTIVTAAPLPVAAVLDGIQHRLIVGWRSHRPVSLDYVAAAAVTAEQKPLMVAEHLQLTCSYHDREWAQSLSDLPVAVLDAHEPTAVLEEAAELVDARRAELEAYVAANATVERGEWLLVDGSIRALTAAPHLVGVVKDTSTQWTTDPAQLDLPAGWRSQRLRLHAPDRTRHAVWTCYVRLHDADEAAGDHGLVRVEAHDVDILDRLAAHALGDRQPPGSPDARWDRHLRGVRGCEEWLRARMPAVYRL